MKKIIISLLALLFSISTSAHEYETEEISISTDDIYIVSVDNEKFYAFYKNMQPIRVNKSLYNAYIGCNGEHCKYLFKGIITYYPSYINLKISLYE